MIVDTSVLIALMRAEPEARALGQAMREAPVRRLSAATYGEVAAVVDGAGDAVATSALDDLLAVWQIRVEPFTAAQARIARTAYQRFGRGGGHPARLNLGDCFSYALARDLGEPLLFKGEDFTHTDIELVVEPIRGKRLSEVVAGYDASAPGLE